MMGPMPPLPTHPYRPATGPPHPHTARYVAGQRSWLSGGGGLYMHVPPLWVGVKSDSTVSNSFPLRAARARWERPGWQMTPNICVTQPLQMRDFASQSLSLSVYGTLPLSSHYPYSWHNIKNDRLPVKITLKWLITIILFKVEIFLPSSP